MKTSFRFVVPAMTLALAGGALAACPSSEPSAGQTPEAAPRENAAETRAEPPAEHSGDHIARVEPSAAPAAAAGPEDSATAQLPGHVAKLTVTDTSVSVAVTEPGGEPPESADNASLTLLVGNEQRRIGLAGSAGRFTGTTDLRGVPSVVAVLQLELDGRPRSTRFTLTRGATAAPGAR